MLRRCLWPLLLVTSVASAQPPLAAPLATGPDPDACGDEVLAATHPAPVGRSIADLDQEACLGVLRARNVRYERIDPSESRGVGMPIRLRSPLAGIEVGHRGSSELHEIIDCRLAVALLEWAPHLRGAGFDGVRHVSIYRPGARVARSGRVSGHAHGLAIDVARLVKRDGQEVAVLEDWESRERGVDPCEGPFEEDADSAALRAVVCAAVERDLFQVVLTPHHDRAHQDHVHLELRPGVDWSFVH